MNIYFGWNEKIFAIARIYLEYIILQIIYNKKMPADACI